MKAAYLGQTGELKCVIAYNLYLMGEKKFVRPGVLECLKNGYSQQLNSFIYGRKVDGVMIQVSIMGENNPHKIDEDAHETLRIASGSGYPEEIRVGAAEMLIKLGDKEAALKVV